MIGTNSIRFTGLLVYILGIYLGKDGYIIFALKYVRGCDISENIRLEDVKGGNQI